MKKNTYIIMAILMAVLVGCSQANEEQIKEKDSGHEENNEKSSNQEGSAKTESGDELTAPFEGDLEHVHGMGYIDDETLVYAAHSGLKLYKSGNWLESIVHKNDYMGFNVVDDGFYTSGHPGPESDLPNPIGLQKGKVSEKGLNLLGFEGESDFHVMGVGYRNHAIYILNEHPNSEMEKGLYKSFDDGATWTEAEAENLGESINQIAVHPDNKNIVAAAGRTGIYMSQDAGKSFTKISDQGQGSGLYFSEEQLYYGLYTGTSSLYVYNLEKESTNKINLPDIGEDAVLFVAQNPENDKQLAIFTVKASSFISKDAGKSWTQVLEKGNTK